MKNHQKQLYRMRGFTLVEIMIVVAIIAVLAAIAIPQLIESRKMSKQNRCLNNLKVIDYCNQQYQLNMGLTSGYIMDVSELPAVTAFAKDDGNLTCPSGGTYYSLDLGIAPSCNYHGTVASPTALSALTAD